MAARPPADVHNGGAGNGAAPSWDAQERTTLHAAAPGSTSEQPSRPSAGSGQAATTTGTGTGGRSHVHIQPELPHPRGSRNAFPPSQGIGAGGLPVEMAAFAYPPTYPSASATATGTASMRENGVAGRDTAAALALEHDEAARSQAYHHAPPTQAAAQPPASSGSAFSRFTKRPTAQTYKSNSSAEWARLLGRAGYAAAPQADEGSVDPNWAAQSQGFRGPGTPASPTHFLCLPLTRGVLRRLVFIFFVTALLWVPGIVALAAYGARSSNSYSNPRVWKVGIFWWSCWLSSIWVGWFVSVYVSRLVPRLLGGTVGAFSVEIKHYLQYLKVLSKYIALFAWTILVWISWLAVIWNNFQDPARNDTITPATSNSSASGLAGLDPNGLFNTTTILGDSSLTSTYNLMLTLTHLWFGLIICSALLLAEKFLIQIIALSFHRVSYEDRLAQNKLHVEILTTLYDHAMRSGVISSAASSRPGTPTKGFSTTKTDASKSSGKRSYFDYERLQLSRRARRTRSEDGQANNSIMGYVAAELGFENEAAAQSLRLRFKNGMPVPSKVSPRTAVLVALCSGVETRKLSYRIFRAFSHWEAVEDGTDEVERVMEYSDIARFFATAAAAKVAWELLDKDGNGSVTEEEMLAAGQEVHRERDSLMNSMRDVDSAVGRLDQVFMSFFSIISVVIVAGLISTKFASLVTSFSTLLLGLSWLLSATAQEALSAIIFLFVKHPYDVGDRVEVDGGPGVATYLVAEINLLSTIFKTTTGKYVQLSHSVLTTKMITNLRRSGPIEETITFEVPYSTTFEQIEQLRERMIDWIATQPRDFFPGLNIAVVALPEFKSIKLESGIRYKSNWQAGALKTMRKNRWMCRFKEILSETGIALPDAPSTTRVTLIPYPPPESETAKPSAAEALAATRTGGLLDPGEEGVSSSHGGGGVTGTTTAATAMREFNFLDGVEAQDAKLLSTRAVRQRGGGQEGSAVPSAIGGATGFSSARGGEEGEGEMRRRPVGGGQDGEIA